MINKKQKLIQTKKLQQIVKQLMQITNKAKFVVFDFN